MSEAQRKAEVLRSLSDFTVRTRIIEWLRNLFKNEENIKSGHKLVELQNRLKDMPCVVVGAGPSLDLNKHLLKAAKNRAFIICVDTALEAIKDIVIPDAVIAMESRPELLKFIDLKVTKDIILFTELTITPELPKKWKGPVFWFTAGFAGAGIVGDNLEQTFNNHKPIGRILSGGCVGNGGFAIAKEILNCDPIILVGMDCGWYNHEQHHTAGIKQDPGQTQVEFADEDIYGGHIYTTDVFRGYRYWIEGVVRTKNPATGRQDCEGIFINATEGGAIQSGWIIMTLQTAITKYLPNKYNFEDILDLDKKIEGKPRGVKSSRITSFKYNDITEVTNVEDKNGGENVAPR